MIEDGIALVVEDNLETQDWLVSCVATAFSHMVISAVDTVAGASDLISSKNFDLALIDLGLPDGSGLDLIKLLKAKNADCHIVVATIYDDDKNLFTALRAGAKGYILKDQDEDKIVSYLQGIKQNRPALSAASSARLIDHFNSKGMELEQSQLTPREIEVTRLVAKGYSVEETADLLELSPDTVKGYVKNIYKKLDVNNRSEVTMAAIKLGLVEPE
ncbi:MAG: DNA-binding response regulator [SAR86 cluster bacterium]|uniref:DNA-binding response regulator n=1 Tax=SAR86 cluster bacterium TaxID=2030880 RepID=A0A2A5AVH3_9GAMM|nr:MAG: DNA-binding response regulator [SAR86 cluster bacterium]